MAPLRGQSAFTVVAYSHGHSCLASALAEFSHVLMRRRSHRHGAFCVLFPSPTMAHPFPEYALSSAIPVLPETQQKHEFSH